MGRRKRKSDRGGSCNDSTNDCSGSGQIDSSKNVLKNISKVEYIRISEPPVEWNMDSFLRTLHPSPCATDSESYDSSYNYKKLYSPTEKDNLPVEMSFPLDGLRKMTSGRCFAKHEKIFFIFQQQKFCSRKLSMGKNGVLQVTSDQYEETVTSAFAALVLSKVFNEGKLARLLFENFLGSLLDKKRQTATIYHSPIPETITHVLYSLSLPTKLKTTPVRLMKCPSPSILDPYYFEPSFTSAIIDATCRTPTNLIDSKKALQRTPLLLSFFLKSAYKPPSINLSQFFKAPAATSISNIKQSGQNPAGMMLDRLQTLQFPSELTSVLEDFAVDDFEVETYIFSCNTFIYGCKVPVDPLLQSYVEAFSDTASIAREACCALLIAHFYGYQQLARSLLVRCFSNDIRLYEKPQWPGMPKKETVNSGSFLPFLECKQPISESIHTCLRLTGPTVLATETKPISVTLQLLTLTGSRVPVKEGVPYEKLETCFSPKQALDILENKSFCFESLVYLPYRAEDSLKKITSCSFTNGEQLLGKRFYSTKAYVAMQMCCADLLCNRLTNARLPAYLINKFCRVYKKHFECFSRFTKAASFTDRQLLSFSKPHAPALVEEIKLEDEYFSVACQEKRPIKAIVVDPSNCSDVNDQLSFLHSFTVGVCQNLQPSTFTFAVSDAKSDRDSIFVSENTAIFQLMQSELVLSYSVESLFRSKEFIVQLTVNQSYCFVARSSKNFEAALDLASYEALSLIEAFQPQNPTSLFQNLSDSGISESFILRTMVNVLKEHHKIDIADLVFSFAQSKEDQTWTAEASFEEERVFSSPFVSKSRAFLDAIAKLFKREFHEL